MFSIISITITIIISIPWEVISAPRKVAQKKTSARGERSAAAPSGHRKKTGRTGMWVPLQSAQSLTVDAEPSQKCVICRCVDALPLCHIIYVVGVLKVREHWEY